MSKEKIPNPGTEEAIDAGCTCPVMDNGHGKGAWGIEGAFWYTEGCPIHRSAIDSKVNKLSGEDFFKN